MIRKYEYTIEVLDVKRDDLKNRQQTCDDKKRYQKNIDELWEAMKILEKEATDE